MIADAAKIRLQYKPTPFYPGDTAWTWCSRHMDRTNHIWTGSKMICLECHPEFTPKERGNDDHDKRDSNL